MRQITSSRLTLILIALLSGIYLLLSFMYDEPLHTLLETPIYSAILILLSLHLSLKGLYRVSSRGLRAIPSAMILISLSFLISGVDISYLQRNEQTYRMAISDRTSRGQTLEDIRMDIPEEITVVGEDHDIEIRDIRAIIDEPGGRHELRPFPLVRTSSGYAYINDANISPLIEFITPGGRQVLSKIEILPPSDRTLSLRQGYSLNISLAEYKKSEKEGIGPRHYRLDRPSYRIRLTRDEEVVLEGVMGDNQVLKGRGVMLRTGRTHRWVEVVFVKDRLVFLLYLSIVLLLSGILLYPLEVYMRFKL
jgi:hypothetical protein